MPASPPRAAPDVEDGEETSPCIRRSGRSDESENGALSSSSSHASVCNQPDNDNDNGQHRKGKPMWNVLAFIMVGITVVFAVDSVEMKRSTLAETAQHTERKATAPPSSTGGSATAESNLAVEAQHTERKATVPPSTGGSARATADESPADGATYFLYHPRGRVSNAATSAAQGDDVAPVDGWGAWSLDGDLSSRRARLGADFYAAYPHRDVPRDEFPPDAWQTDAEYLTSFLSEGIALVGRAQEAILAEYGHGRTTQDGDGEDAAESPEAWRERAAMFQLDVHDSLNGVTVEKRKNKKLDRGGWTTTSSWEGLKRRILHAIMTEDSFVFAMGGHSAAAGHGNHFQQSYTLQVQWILEAVFARLGVKHEARNFGNGGLGTAHNAMAATSIYGPDVDILMWDSSMTEKGDVLRDLFHRQALIGGGESRNAKVPVLWTNAGNTAKFFNERAGADVGGVGSGRSGIASASNLEQLNELPWAVRYMDCSDDLTSICKDHEYDGVCWVDRPDFTPTRQQQEHPGGRAGWHPGNRNHQLTGRVLTFTLLQAMKEALTMWNEAVGYVLPDDAWHVTALYDSIRAGVHQHIDEGGCNELHKAGLLGLCRFPMKGRTEFTPRAYPSRTSIRSLMPSEMLKHIDPPEDPVYDPPDVFNPALHPGDEDAVDVLSIVEAGSPFQPVLMPDYASGYYKQPAFASPPKVPVGKGVTLKTKAGDYLCDGTLHSWCDRGADQDCLLMAHNDGRNGLLFDSYSGWIVMNVPDLKNGFIVVKFESWHQEGEASKTEGWGSINNDEGDHEDTRLLLQLRPSAVADVEGGTTGADPPVPIHYPTNSSRSLGKDENYCADFRFEYAVDGIITSLVSSEFEARREVGQIQRVVETLVLLDDRNYTGGIEKEVEVAVRITGCGRKTTFNLNHIYWS